VKEQADTLLAAKIAASLVDAKGDLLVGTANDTVARLAVGSDGQVLVADASQTPGVKWATGPAEVLISENAIGSATASVTFSSIAQTYRDLRIVVRGRGDVAANDTDVRLRFNGDTGANYDYVNVVVNGGGSFNGESYAQSGGYMGTLAGASLTAGFSDASEARIYDYRGTTFHKPWLSESGIKRGTTAGNMFRVATSGWWRSTAAITSVTVLPLSGNFIAGTVVSLYGVN
jgi:hypothetical protein